MMNLKAININALGEEERERLRSLSTQYQFYLTQFQHHQRQSILMGQFGGETSRKTDKDSVMLESTDTSKNETDNAAQANTDGKDADGLPPLPFQFHLNLPNPVPQITTQDIKSLIGPQRC